MKSINRKEAFMAAMAGEGEAPKPLTREEEFASKIADRIGQGSGGSDLPEVTAVDNNRVLQAINGAWVKGRQLLPVLYATFTYDEQLTQWTCDKSVEQVISYIETGYTVCAKVQINGNIFAVLPVTGLIYVEDNIVTVAFSAVAATSDSDVRAVTSAFIGYSALGISCEIQTGYLSETDPNT